MKRIIPLMPFLLIIICSCKQTFDKTDYDLQVKIKDSLKVLVWIQQCQIDTLRNKLDSINTKIVINTKTVIERKAARLTDYTFKKIAAAIMREFTKRNLKQGENQPPEIIKEILVSSFDQCGYNYPATLHKVAQTGFTPFERQFVVICLLPVADKKTKNELGEVYQGQELEDVSIIFDMFQ